MKEVLIDGVKYERVSDETGAFRIVVLDRGFVVVGRVTEEGNYIVIRECRCVRKWGTIRGLGELADEGPKPKTVLDPQPTTRVHQLQVVQMIDCVEEKWTL